MAAQSATSSRAIVNTKKTLEDSGVKILGAVLNKVRYEKTGYGGYGKYYGGYYGSYYGGYYGRDKEDEEDSKQN